MTGTLDARTTSALDLGPARALVACDRPLDLVRETASDPHRDFFLRMSSFSLPLGDDRTETSHV